MGIFSRLGASLVPALNSGVWALVFLEDRSGPNLLIVPMLMAAVAVGLRRPLLGVLVLGATGAFAVLIGLSYGELELFVGCLVVLGWAGRYAISVWVGILGVALVAGSASLRDGFTLRKLVVSTFVFGSVWLFGRLVRHRAIAAARAIEEAEELAHTDPRALAHPRTADERRRVADGAARNLRVAVHDMVTAIDAILSDHAPDLAAVRRVRERGARTVEELRNLLVILRAEPAPTLGSAPPPPNPLRFDLALAAVAAAFALLGLWRVDGWAGNHGLPLAYAGVVTALALRRTAPLVAGSILTIAAIPLALVPPQDPESLLLIAAGDAAVCWVLSTLGGRRRIAVIAALAAVSLALGSRFGADGAAFIGVVLVISLASGMAWYEPDRMLIRARARSQLLRTALEEATAEAVRQERLRIARDLHDATSHAVGVMLLQVSAAEAQLRTDPQLALAALATAKQAGEQAKEASNPLLPGLGASDLPGVDTLRTELVALVQQWRACGMRVKATINPPLLVPPELAVTCYRVVQEALTNASRHAPGGEVEVRVLTHRRQFLVEVEDTGATKAVSSTSSGEMGLAGLRERVVANLGHFTAVSRGKGFRVTARFELPSSRSRS